MPENILPLRSLLLQIPPKQWFQLKLHQVLMHTLSKHHIMHQYTDFPNIPPQTRRRRYIQNYPAIRRLTSLR